MSGNCLVYIDGLVQDCRNSIANALELLQSCTKPSICVRESTDMVMTAQNIPFDGITPSNPSGMS